MKKSSQGHIRYLQSNGAGGFSAIILVVIIVVAIIGGGLVAWKQGWIPRFSGETADWKTYANNDYGFEFKYPQTWQLNSDVSSGAIHLYVDFAKFSSLIDNKETCINGICSRKSPTEDQRIINQASVGDEIETNSGLPGKVVSIGGVKGFRYLGYNPQAKAYNTGVVVFNSQVDRIELSMPIAATNETQAENDKLNKDFNQIISTFKFTK
jgi:hypothetical protein